jgi:hypothetical protein
MSTSFLLPADAVDNYGDYTVSVFYTLQSEVDSLRTHVKECNGSYKLRAPLFGLEKRSMSYAFGQSHASWVV